MGAAGMVSQGSFEHLPYRVQPETELKRLGDIVKKDLYDPVAGEGHGWTFI